MASTVNPLYDGPKAEVRRKRSSASSSLSGDEYPSSGAGGHGASSVGRA